MYDGLADNYNYGTNRSSYYSKFQTGNGSWGYPVRSCDHAESRDAGGGLGSEVQKTPLLLRGTMYGGAGTP